MKGFQISKHNILMNYTLQTFLFIFLNFPFLFALTIKGLKFASIGVFVCHILFILVSLPHIFILIYKGLTYEFFGALG